MKKLTILLIIVFYSTFIFANAIIEPQPFSLFFNAEQNDYVKIPKPNFIDFLDKDFSIETVFNISKFTEKKATILHFYNENESLGFIEYIREDGKLVFLLNRTEYIVSKFNFKEDKCYSTSIVKLGNKLLIYINGSLVLSERCDERNTLIKETPFYIGGNRDRDNFFGKIDEVRLFNNALSEREINENLFHELTTINENLLAYFKFNNEDSQIVRDFSFYENSGYLGGSEENIEYDPERIKQQCVDVYQEPVVEEINFCGSYIRPNQPVVDPNSDEEYYIDRFNNIYLASELAIPENGAFGARSPQDTNLFEIHYDSTQITQPMRDVINQVFSDVEVLINQRQPNFDDCNRRSRVHIKVKTFTDNSDIIAQGGSYYRLHGSENNHLIRGNTWKVINGISTPLGSSTTNGTYDGLLRINLSHQNHLYYGFQNPIPNTTKTDFYSVMLHEILHILGIHSFIHSNGDGSGKGYTIYDTHLFDNAQQLIINNNPAYDWSYNNSLSSASLTSGCQNIHYFNDNNNVNSPVFAPNIWSDGSSLSHFDNDCNGGPYIMNSGILPGIAGHISNREAQILQNLGYDINTTYGEQNLITGGGNPRNHTVTLNTTPSFLATSDDMFCDFLALENCGEIAIPYDYILKNDIFSGNVQIINTEAKNEETGIIIQHDDVANELIISIDNTTNLDRTGELLIRYQITDGINVSEASSVIRLTVFQCNTDFFTNDSQQDCDIISNSEFVSTNNSSYSLDRNHSGFLPNWSFFTDPRLALNGRSNTLYNNGTYHFQQVNIINTPLSNSNGHILMFNKNNSPNYDSGLFTHIDFAQTNNNDNYILSYFRAIGQNFNNTANLTILLTDVNSANYPRGISESLHDDILSSLNGYETLYDDTINSNDSTSWGHVLLNFNPDENLTPQVLAFLTNGTSAQIDNVQLFKDQFANDTLPDTFIYNEDCDDSTLIDIDLCEIPGIIYHWYDITDTTVVDLGLGNSNGTININLTEDRIFEVKREFENPTINNFTLPNRENQVLDNDLLLVNGYASHVFNIEVQNCGSINPCSPNGNWPYTNLGTNNTNAFWVPNNPVAIGSDIEGNVFVSGLSLNSGYNLTKLNKEGDFQWSNSIGSIVPHSLIIIKTDNNLNVYIQKNNELYKYNDLGVLQWNISNINNLRPFHLNKNTGDLFTVSGNQVFLIDTNTGNQSLFVNTSNIISDIQFSNNKLNIFTKLSNTNYKYEQFGSNGNSTNITSSFQVSNSIYKPLFYFDDNNSYIYVISKNTAGVPDNTIKIINISNNLINEFHYEQLVIDYHNLFYDETSGGLYVFGDPYPNDSLIYKIVNGVLETKSLTSSPNANLYNRSNKSITKTGGCIYITSTFKNTNLLNDNISINTNNLIGQYVVRLKNSTNTFYRNSENNILTEEVIDVYPNPFKTKFIIDFKNKKSDTYKVELYTIYNEKIANLSVNTFETIIQEINVPQKYSGIFILKITNSNGESIIKKIVK